MRKLMFIPKRATADRTNAKKERDTRHFNTLALIGFVFAFCVPFAGFVLSAIAWRRLRTLDERGINLAIFGTCIGLFTTAYSIYHTLQTAGLS
jgi:hypothetical protein